MLPLLFFLVQRGIQLEQSFRKFHLQAFLYSTAPPDEQERLRKNFGETITAKNAGALSSFADWQKQNFRRLGFRAQWQAYFEQVDVFLSPVAFSATFPHDHSEPQEQRRAQNPLAFDDKRHVWRARRLHATVPSR